MKKLIGYKCPTDLFNGKVKKGTIYKINRGSICDSLNTCGWTDNPEYAYTNLPVELVSQWQPVYAEESKTLKLGDKGVEVKIPKGKIEVEGSNIDIEDLDELWNSMNNDGTIARWDITYPSVKLGYTTFTKEEIKQVIDTYNELNS